MLPSPPLSSGYSQLNTPDYAMHKVSRLNVIVPLDHSCSSVPLPGLPDTTFHSSATSISARPPCGWQDRWVWRRSYTGPSPCMSVRSYIGHSPCMSFRSYTGHSSCMSFRSYTGHSPCMSFRSYTGHSPCMSVRHTFCSVSRLTKTAIFNGCTMCSVGDGVCVCVSSGHVLLFLHRYHS